MVDGIEKSGELIELQGNNPFLIDNPDYIWVVKEGRVNLYAVYLKDKNIVGIRNYICTVEKDENFLGQKPDDRLGYLAVGETGTKVLKIKLTESGDKLPFYIDKWIDIFTKGIIKDILPPRKFKLFEEDCKIELEKDEYIVSLEKVLWVKHEEGSSTLIGGEDFPEIKGDSFFPISKYIWFKGNEKSIIKAVTTEEYLSQESDLSSFYKFQKFISEILKIRIIEKNIKEKEDLEKREEGDLSLFGKALSNIASTMESAKEAHILTLEEEEPLFIACQKIGKIQGINFIRPDLSEKERKLETPLSAIARATRARTRQVLLQWKWWEKDSGPILGYMKESKSPVALLPYSGKSYDLFDPVENKTRRVTEEVASELSPEAFIFYKPLPHKPLGIKDILKFEFQWCRGDFLNFILAGIFAGLLGTSIPLATGVIFDAIIPGAETNRLLQISLALFVSALSVVMFQLTQTVAILRIEGKLKGTLQSAMWDRILELPCSFFRKFTAGDLAMRALGIEVISSQLFSGLLLPSILGLIYAGFNFILLFYYDVNLALIGAVFSVIIFIATGLTAYVQLGNQEKLSEIQGKLSGFVFQLINGIAKITVSGSTARAFVKWSEKFSLQKKYSFKASIVNTCLSIFTSIFPVSASVVIFTYIAFQAYGIESGGTKISTGSFIAFNAAFTSFTMALMQLGITIASLVNMIPMYNRMRPILETLPEVDTEKPSPGELTGEIEVNHVSFRYNKEGKFILNDISFQANPGEFIAFVGPSGAGKSTLLRLLLGFETPETGSVYYNGKDIQEVDLSSVRRQIGVVLQNNKLMAGSISFNIIGSSLLTVDDAWEAAELAGLADDIREMPMGMHTFVGEGGGTFSGGQKQRLLIARALVRKPRIILFDEATSALDNKTQNIVTESLSKLNATRLVIAHRLSTVIGADRIYVMEKGRIIQSGNYEELMKIEGPFKELAKRQIL